MDNLYIGEEARTRLMNGVVRISEAVGKTMGTSGQNSLLETIERPFHWPSNDGYQIANAIKLADPIEDMGRLILCEAINRANKASGDGSSTTCVLTSAILEAGMKHLGEVSPMDMKRSLEACIPSIEESVKQQTKEIDVNSVAQVASISAEDEDIGNRIQEIYQKIGKDGIIQWDISKTAEDSYTIGTGITVHGATYAAPYMADEGSSEIRLTNPHILLARKKITTALDFENLFPILFQKDIKEIVIFCEDIEVQVIADLYKTQRIRGFKTVVIKMPILWRDEWWEDLGLATGGTVIDVASGIKLNETSMEHLGTVEHMTVTREDTHLDGIQDLTKHILALKVDGTDQSLVRAARLNTQTARYFVGGHSESEIGRKRMKVEDAINAAAVALDSGVVPGGGIALLNASKTLSDMGIGGIILQEALKAPFRNIVANAGGQPDVLVKEVSGNQGLNSKTHEIVDMVKAGIVDPTSVVTTAVKNAIGVAATILTIGNVILLPKQDATTSKMPHM